MTLLSDEQLFNYVADVIDENADPNLQTVGNCLVVDNGKTKQTFSDLDELIVNYVQAMARKAEELMAHEKFKAGTEDELRMHFRFCSSHSQLTMNRRVS